MTSSEELHFTVSSPDRTTAGLWGCTQTCPRYRHACVEVGHRCFTWAQNFITTDPLPPSCPCISAHSPLKGVDSREEFHSTSSSALGEQFWWLCAVPFLDPENASLRVGESAHAAYSGPGFLHSRSGIPSAHLFLPFLLPHRRCAGYSPTGEKAP